MNTRRARPLRPRSLARALTLAGTLAAAPALAGPIEDLIAEVEALAAAEGIPADPLLRKISEGQAKGVPAPRIRPAVVQLGERLVRGRDLCGEAADPLCVEAAADAVANGFADDALRGLAGPGGRALEAGERTRAFVALSLLRARGAEAPAAVETVSAALSSDRLDALLPRAAEPAAPPGGLGAPPAVGRGGELPVQNPTRDRDGTGPGKAWGRGKDGAGRPDEAGPPENPGNAPDDRGRPDDPGPPEGAGRPETPGRP